EPGNALAICCYAANGRGGSTGRGSLSFFSFSSLSSFTLSFTGLPPLAVAIRRSLSPGWLDARPYSSIAMLSNQTVKVNGIKKMTAPERPAPCGRPGGRLGYSVSRLRFRERAGTQPGYSGKPDSGTSNTWSCLRAIFRSGRDRSEDRARNARLVGPGCAKG